MYLMIVIHGGIMVNDAHSIHSYSSRASMQATLQGQLGTGNRISSVVRITQSRVEPLTA